MSKIICDICGTVYQDTAENCPICGYSQSLEDSFAEEFLMEDTARLKGGRFAQSKRKKEIFDYNEVNHIADDELDEDPDDEEYGADEDYDEPPKSNAAIVVFLVIVIMLLLAAIGFVVFRYLLPNLNTGEASRTPALMATEPAATETEETTEPAIPCESIVLTGGMAELSREGQYWLLHVKVMPEDTTDDLIFISEDEAVATVTQDGKITAVGEGDTTIYITCGKQQINCPVIVRYAEETEPSEEGTLPDVTGEAGTDSEEETVPVEETAAPELLDVELALEKYDISLSVGYGITLHLDCPLAATDVEWSVEHPNIATVDENGFVKAVGYGTTAVIVKYGDQEVTCMVRCK